jgi:hypothetical protein
MAHHDVRRPFQMVTKVKQVVYAGIEGMRRRRTERFPMVAQIDQDETVLGTLYFETLDEAAQVVTGSKDPVHHETQIRRILRTDKGMSWDH